MFILKLIFCVFLLLSPVSRSLYCNFFLHNFSPHVGFQTYHRIILRHTESIDAIEPSNWDSISAKINLQNCILANKRLHCVSIQIQTESKNG